MVSPAPRLLLFGLSAALCVALLEPGWTSPCAAESSQPAAAATQLGTGTGSAMEKQNPLVAPVAPKVAPLPTQYGMSLEYGYTYDPGEDLSFLLARVFAIYDYGTVWHQDRPAALRFKVEAAAGSTLTPDSNLIVSLNMLALYYPGRLTGATLRPYLEGGIGGIYTEYRVKGQGLHYNFNPLLGVGCELPQTDGKNPFAAIRLHHVSNAGLNHHNRGVNSVELQVGRFF
jgi:lipid A 3-O-deacylase